MPNPAPRSPAFEFRAADHAYFLDGQQIPSVTQVIRCLSDGYAGIPPHVLEYARQRGTAVHKAIELHSENDLDVASLDLAIVPYFSAWIKFLEDTGAVVVGYEQPMFSLPYRFGGTPDLWCEIGPILWLPDVKCTAATVPTTSIQTAAYQRLVQELTGRKARRAELRLLDNGQYRFNPYPQAEDAADMGTFTACLNLHNWRAKHHGNSRAD